MCIYTNTQSSKSSGMHGLFRDAYRSDLWVCAEAQGMGDTFSCKDTCTYSFFTESTHMHFFGGGTVTGLKGLGFNSLEEVQRQTLKMSLFPIILTRKAGDSGQSRGDTGRSS